MLRLVGSTARVLFPQKLRGLSILVDPPYQVSIDEQYVDPKSIQIPYLRDGTRQEMYRKHMEDPISWSIQKLSEHYGTSRDRTNAVIFLMGRREELQAKLGAVKIPTEHQSMYDKHRLDAEAHTPEKLSEEFGIDISQVYDVLKNLKIHYARLNTLQKSEEHKGGIMAKMEEEGIETSFKEIPNEGRLARTYLPRFFRDDAEEETLRDLKRLIAKDTRAKVEPAIDDYVNAPDRSNLLAPEEPNNAQVKTDTFSRWKFAYRDSSKLTQQPTMIRTRSGGWRVANVYEEYERSWSRAPSYINQAMHEHKLKEYLDPDKDEQRALQLVKKKKQALESRKKMLNIKA